jgi:hypothetical protein
MTVEDFTNYRDYLALSDDDRLLVDYLESYIKSKQAPFIDREEVLACGS